jgi:hypothetical protein
VLHSVINRCVIFDSTVEALFVRAFKQSYIVKFFADVFTSAPVIFGFGLGMSLVTGCALFLHCVALIASRADSYCLLRTLALCGYAF